MNKKDKTRALTLGARGKEHRQTANFTLWSDSNWQKMSNHFFVIEIAALCFFPAFNFALDSGMLHFINDILCIFFIFLGLGSGFSLVNLRVACYAWARAYTHTSAGAHGFVKAFFVKAKPCAEQALLCLKRLYFFPQKFHLYRKKYSNYSGSSL